MKLTNKEKKNVATIIKSIDKDMLKLKIDYELHAQAIVENDHFEAIKMNDMFNLHCNALLENAKREFDKLSYREQRAEVKIKRDDTLSKKATLFTQCIVETAQNYRIDRALEQFHSMSELIALTKCSKQRIVSHVRYIEKNMNHTCKKVIHATDKSKFKFELLK